MQKNRQVSVEVTKALVNFPYFVLKNEIDTGYNLYTQEIQNIKQNYIDYKYGAEFYTEGTAGDYVPSTIHFKEMKKLIDKEARFMFSQTPDVNIQHLNENDEEGIKYYKELIDKVLRRTKFGSKLLKSAKDCFVGGRVACLVDFSEQDGIQIHFYNALQFYYETDYDSDRITKFISFKLVNKSKSNREKLYLVKKYTETKQGIVFSSILYDGTGNVVNEIIKETKIDLDYIPAFVIKNDGLLEDDFGVSEIEDMEDLEAGYSRLANGDIDSERKGMNPIRYTVDMSPRSTQSLPSGAGAYWDLEHNQNINDPRPSVGTLAPAMNHTEPVKATLERIKSTMHSSVDVPDISQDGLLSGITSFKALKALYYPLTVRCNEKLKEWKPALESAIRTVIDLCVLNREKAIELYVLSDLKEYQYNVEIVENYALLDDENEEKEIDLAEIAQNTRSRKSYINKWRTSEFRNEEQVEEELLQIAMELNMFDTMSMNTQVQTKLQETEIDKNIEKNIEQTNIEQQQIEE